MKNNAEKWRIYQKAPESVLGGVSEERERNGIEAVFEGTIAKNLPELKKDMSL